MSRRAALTFDSPRITRETTDFDTPARAATSRIVAGRTGRAGPVPVLSQFVLLGGAKVSEQEAQRLVAGMVGGGDGADIGKTHRHAMRLDDLYELAAGVFGQDVQSGARMAQSLGVPADRA